MALESTTKEVPTYYHNWLPVGADNLISAYRLVMSQTGTTTPRPRGARLSGYPLSASIQVFHPSRDPSQRLVDLSPAEQTAARNPSIAIQAPALV